MSEIAHGRAGAKTVLYIDDSQNDQVLFHQACQITGVSFVLKLAVGGREGIRYLSGAGEFADRGAHPLPAFILLDINMPDVDGFEVLNWIRNHAQVSKTPVGLYSSSTVDKDVLRGYLGGTTFYIPKTQGVAALRELARGLDECLQSGGADCERLLKLSIEPANV